jgi:anti-sigma regulatory factor (Ser/Thr protein kinase)
MSDMFAKALSLGGTGLGLARQLMDSMGNSAKPSVEETVTQNGDLNTRA